MLKLKDYLYNRDKVEIHEYLCIMCEDIATNVVKCLECNAVYCNDCSELVKKLGKNCLKHKGKLINTSLDEEKNKFINNGMLFWCSNKGCNEIMSYNKINFHYLVCDNLLINCPFKNCNFKGNEADINYHRKACEFSNSICYICGIKLYQNNKNEHNCFSTLVEELMLLEQELISKHSQYINLIDSLKTETKCILKDKESLFKCCKQCFSCLSWINQLKSRHDCQEGSCIERSRFYCDECDYYYCVKCVPPPRNFICGCKQQMERFDKELDDDYNRTCDICGNEVEGEYSRCEDCDFDVCVNCFCEANLN